MGQKELHIKTGSVKKQIALSEMRSVAKERGFEQCNTCMVTLVDPDGSFNSQDDFLDNAHELLQDFEYLLTMELINTEEYSRFIHIDNRSYNHTHSLVKGSMRELKALEEKWYTIVGSRAKKLFHARPLERDVNHVLGYILKEREEEGVIHSPYGWFIEYEMDSCSLLSLDLTPKLNSWRYLLSKKTLSTFLNWIVIIPRKNESHFNKILSLFQFDGCWKYTELTPSFPIPPPDVSNKGM